MTSAAGIASTEYTIGQGHLKYCYKARLKAFLSRSAVALKIKHAIDFSCESGEYYQSFALQYPSKFPVPSIADVLHSLSVDSEVSNYQDFEEWASEYGYDVDSRSVENIYKSCQKIAKDFRKLLTMPQRDELSELLQDY